jgi:FMN reductase
MTAPLRVAVVVGNPRPGSRTRKAAEAIAGALVADLATKGVTTSGVDVLDLAELVSVTFGPRAVPAAQAVDDPFAAVREAGLVVVATPAYKGTFTGLLKVYLDQFGHQALAGAVAVPVGIGASDTHRDAAGLDLARVLEELGATVPVGPAAISESDLDALDGPVQEWTARSAGAIAEALRAKAAVRR